MPLAICKQGVAGGIKGITSLVITRYLRIKKPSLSPPSGLSARIRYYRQTKGLSRQKLAEIAGISVNTLAKYERNEIKSLNPCILQKIAKALEINPVKLLPSDAKVENFYDYIIPGLTLGSRIKNYRLRKGLSQKKFARMLNLSRETIRRYEKDLYAPDQETFREIAKVLGVSMRSLLNGKLKKPRGGKDEKI